MKVTIAPRYASVRLYLRAASVDDDILLAHWTVRETFEKATGDVSCSH
jgi:hypothetical protein